jgi:hypothetical protein
VSSSEHSEEVPSFIEMNSTNVRFVHYPGCQQLCIWLTHPGREYGSVRLRNKITTRVIEEWPVTDHLSGSIQIVWDTLAVAPGNYTIEIGWKNGWQHHIDIMKYEEPVAPQKKSPGPSIETVKQEEKTPSEPVVYKDGFGNILVNEDLVLRDKLIKDVSRKFSRRIEYQGSFRAGTIIYTDNDTHIEFSHEMGGGNCMFYIDVPPDAQWEAQTKTPLPDKKEILEYVAKTVQAQQVSNCRFEIKEDTIHFYYR